MAMTEQEWLACTDPQAMLAVLRGKQFERKLRLFLVADARSVWDQISEQTWRTAVETAERFADGLATKDELERINIQLFRELSDGIIRDRFSSGSKQACLLSLCTTFTNVPTVEQLERRTAWQNGRELASLPQPALLRDIFGNPFRPVTFNPAWRTSNVIALAQAIYDDRAFDRLPILADALEDAGCDSADVLNHCRPPGEHVRGCWVVDLVLGKE
jgi:hypothetical protein